MHDRKPALRRIKAKGAQEVLLVANPQEGVQAVQGMAHLPEGQRLPILSHWGITGGAFHEMVGARALSRVQRRFLQTFSFLNPPRKAAGARLFAAYKA